MDKRYICDPDVCNNCLHYRTIVGDKIETDLGDKWCCYSPDSGELRREPIINKHCKYKETEERYKRSFVGYIAS